MIPKYNKKKLTDIWHSQEEFYQDCANNDIPLKITEENCRLLYSLLYAKFGNSPIANFDENQFKYKIYAAIYKFGGEWEKKVYIQDKLRELDDEEIRKANKSIINHASNPDVAPDTKETNELDFVSDQNVSKQELSKLNAYQFYMLALESDYHDEFIKKFEPCFSKFVDRSCTAVYCSDDDDDEEIQ